MHGKPAASPPNNQQAVVPFSSRLFAAASIVAASSCGQPTTVAPAPVASVKKEAPAAIEKKRLRPSERGEVRSISLSQAFDLQQSGNVIFYDARPSVLYKEGHIAGAISMPKSICEEVIRVREPELKAAKAANKPIIVYCSGVLCADARTVARHLSSSGYSASILEGGWDQWNTAGLPTE